MDWKRSTRKTAADSPENVAVGFVKPPPAAVVNDEVLAWWENVFELVWFRRDKKRNLVLRRKWLKFLDLDIKIAIYLMFSCRNKMESLKIVLNGL